MTKFLIKYRAPQTEEDVQVEAEFSDTAGIPAKDWAEDYAYSLADKGLHTVEEVR